jgi:hypothetical protein
MLQQYQIPSNFHFIYRTIFIGGRNKKKTDCLQVTGKLLSHEVVTSIPHHRNEWSSQILVVLIVLLDVNSTTLRSQPQY